MQRQGLQKRRPQEGDKEILLFKWKHLKGIIQNLDLRPFAKILIDGGSRVSYTVRTIRISSFNSSAGLLFTSLDTTLMRTLVEQNQQTAVERCYIHFTLRNWRKKNDVTWLSTGRRVVSGVVCVHHSLRQFIAIYLGTIFCGRFKVFN